MDLEKRQNKRISIGFKVDFVLAGNKYTGEVENLSEDGACILTLPADIPLEPEPESELDVVFHVFSEETLQFRCRVKWVRKNPSHGLTKKLGLEIIDPAWDKSSIFI